MCSTPSPCLTAPWRRRPTRSVLGIVGRVVVVVVVAAVGAVAAVEALRRRGEERRAESWRAAHERRWVS